MRAKVCEGCIGCGVCESLAEAIFRMNDEGTAEVYGEVTEANLAEAQEAMDNCPVSVIEIEEE